jgi:hypothetical protein
MKRDVTLLMNDDPKYLREDCRRTSQEYPDMIVLGIYIFKMAHVELTDKLRPSDVSGNPFAGYWLNGEFRLFSPAELALGDKDDEDEDEDTDQPRV